MTHLRAELLARLDAALPLCEAAHARFSYAGTLDGGMPVSDLLSAEDAALAAFEAFRDAPPSWAAHPLQNAA